MSLIKNVRRTYRVTTECDVPMKTRDGVTLYADVVRPEGDGRFPVLLGRTPYGKAGSTDPNGENTFFARYGYVCVTQDTRGRWSSEGTFEPIFQEAADGYDAVEWAARLPWSNGRVGMVGQSYLAMAQYQVACTDPMPPSLEVMAPVAGPSDCHQSWVFHSGGASMWHWLVPYTLFQGLDTLRRAGREDLIVRLASYVDGDLVPFRGTKYGINFATPLLGDWVQKLPIEQWVELLKEAAPYFGDYFAHEADGPYWHRANVNEHAESVTVPMMHVASWYDLYAEGGPNAYQSIKARSRHARAREGQRLIVGPWAHLLPYSRPNAQGAGEADFGPDALIDLNETLLRWYEYWLHDIDNGVMDEPPVSVFVMGENRWRSFEDWPPPGMRPVRWYLHSEGSANSLHGDGALTTSPPGDEPADTYAYDPDDPAPTLGGSNLVIDMGVRDQRPVEERDDVLVYTSLPLDRSLVIAGPVSVELWASSSAVDTDFTAKLVDVSPDGYAANLLDGIIRARYRESASVPAPLTPDTPALFTIDLWGVAHAFLPRHRIRLEISSSNFPRFDRNLNTGQPFGQGDQGVVAQQTVLHQGEQASALVLPVLPG